MVKASHKSFNGGVEGLLDRLKKLSSQKVAVGIPADKSEREGPISNADLAYIHTHGVRSKQMRDAMRPVINKGTKFSIAKQMYIESHGSALYDVPARPIIEPAIDNAKAGIAKKLSIAADAAMNNENTENALGDVGLYAQSKVKNWFRNSANGWPANSPKTVKKKKSDRPLIDTGALRQSITYVIRGGDGD
jgi:hypothetical protein